MTLFDYLKHSEFLLNKNTDVRNMLFGMFAGYVGVSVIYPADLVRRKLQLSGLGNAVRYNGIVDCFTRTIKCSGFRGLYRGLLPCYLKVLPMTGLLFATNEKIKSLLKM